MEEEGDAIPMAGKSCAVVLGYKRTLLLGGCEESSMGRARGESGCWKAGYEGATWVQHVPVSDSKPAMLSWCLLLLMQLHRFFSPWPSYSAPASQASAVLSEEHGKEFPGHASWPLNWA